MDIRRFISQKRPYEDTPCEMNIDKGASEELSQVSSGSHSPSSSQSPGIATSHDLLPIPPHSKIHKLSPSELRKRYKAQLSYKREWENKYPWVTCRDASIGMFCTICQKWGLPTAGSRGAWTSRGITDWNHANELLRAHKSHGVIEMLQPLLVCHSRQSAGNPFLSCSVQLLQKRLRVEQRGIVVSYLS